MSLTKEFRDAVSQGNLLRVRIMLKDSLLVDTSFRQFHEMINYAEPRLSDLWISNEDDDEVLSKSPEDLNNNLVKLVNSFSKRRVNHLMELINKKYPPKEVYKKHRADYREQAAIIKLTKSVVDEMKALLKDKKIINEVCSKIVSQREADTNDMEMIRISAMNIIRHCDKISGK